MSLFSLKGSNKNKTLAGLALVIGLIIAINVISNYVHGSLDLTEEGRFKLSTPTKQLMRNLKQPVHVKVLLRSGVPANFEKLRSSTRDLLTRLRDASGNKLSFEFTDPIEGLTGNALKEVYKNLSQKGARPQPITSQLDAKQKTEEQIIFPYALISGNGKEFTIPLFEYHTGMEQSAILNYSESTLEYKVASTIQQLYKPERDKIAWIVGHGEAIGYNTIDALATLESNYSVDTFDLTQNYYIAPNYKCAIICKPTQSFSERDKFKIDQYVMAGGKVLWFVDPCAMNMDTLQTSPSFTVIPYELNIDDLLFKYGVRLNKNLVEDLEANPIPVVTGRHNNQSVQKLFKWVYFPVFTPMSKHPVVNNLDAIMSKFCSTIDTIQTAASEKKILLNTSTKSRALGAPINVSLNTLQYQINPALYTKKYLPTAVCIEGKFTSNYANIMDEGFKKIYEDSLKLKFRTESGDNKMIVVADGDIILNDFSQKQGPLEMGFYRYSREMFANKTFLLNCVEYLINENNLLAARSKEFKLRLLDSDRVNETRQLFQVLNILAPILLCVFGGSLYWFIRKRKYEVKA